jgi:chromate transporter
VQLASQAQQRGVASGEVPLVAEVALFPLLLAFLKLGSISVGGRSASYLLDELVDRRRWLRQEDWLEALLLSRILPGPSGVGVALFMAQLLQGSRGAILAVAVYIAPGIIMAVILSHLVFGVARPVWVDGAIQGLSAGALGLFVQTSLRTAPNSRKARLGPATAVVAFVAYAIVGLDLIAVLVGIGTISIVLNRPGRNRKERS